jgi:RHS repeat-associated protein
MELNAAGATAARYTQALPQSRDQTLGGGSGRYGDLVSQRRSGVSGFYHFDALGTTRRVTAADESTQLTYVRDAFGSGIASTGTTTNRFRYIGKLGYVQEDTLAGALLRRRYYQFEIGRFVSRDPLRDPGRSEYGYVRNAPTRAVDPSGLQMMPPWPGWPRDGGGPEPPGVIAPEPPRLIIEPPPIIVGPIILPPPVGGGVAPPLWPRWPDIPPVDFWAPKEFGEYYGGTYRCPPPGWIERKCPWWFHQAWCAGCMSKCVSECQNLMLGGHMGGEEIGWYVGCLVVCAARKHRCARPQNAGRWWF